MPLTLCRNVRRKSPLPRQAQARSGRFLAAAAAAASAVVTLSAVPAHAAVVQVPCSVSALVAAINTANGSPAPDTLLLAHGCTYRLTVPDQTSPANGLPAITSTLTIEGNGATIRRVSSAPAFRILLVAAGGDLTLDQLTISGGRATDCPIAPGMGVVCGGGINNQGTLTMKRSRLLHNTGSGSVYVEGGGLDSDGTATLKDTEVSGNTAEYTGPGGGTAAGGGIAIDGPLTLDCSRILDNTVRVPAGTDNVAFGGGVAGFAPATVQHSTLSGNSVSAPGGQAFAGGLAADHQWTVSDTHVTDNRVTSRGGTVRGGGIDVGPHGDLSLSASDVRRNTATALGGTARGGGIVNLLGGSFTGDTTQIDGNAARAADGGTAQGGGVYNDIGPTTLKHSSVVRNTAGDGGGIYKASGTAALTDTTVSRNRPNNCAPAGSVPNCTG
ncbi:hypothetical protein ACFZCP_44835 [Streptomyces sp. NPDC007971]|uniref:hypothetical protein n=1 Tax=Streptomyces sp. NPDC007971 TaxID=3364799 RepID=UPI0036F083F3